MSLSGALNSAVSGLKAQSESMAVISDNLSNSETYGYKAQSTQFSALVTTSSSSSAYSSGGVRSTVRQDVSDQGLIETTSSSTDLAIDGDGMFVLSDTTDGTSLYYTRDGEFEIDDDGYLTFGSYYLMGWELDQDGNVVGSSNSSSSLTAVNVSDFSSSATATDLVSISANLPADADTGTTFTTDIEVYDSLGNAATITISWYKEDENSWTASFSNAVDSSDTDNEIAKVTGSASITFNSDGTLASGSSTTLTISDWETGAETSTVEIDFGTVNSADGLTQYASGEDDPSVTVNDIDQNGLAYGTLTGVEVEDDGTVVASYSNGDSVSIYQIPVATFTNYNGLELNTDGVYVETADSGDYILTEAGTGSAGSIAGYSLEDSTVDTATEFSKMIVSQQAYSASAQMITTINDMYDTLISAVR